METGHNLMEYFIRGPIIIFFSVLGLFGNVFSIFVLCQRGMRSPIVLLLIALAIGEVIVLLNMNVMYGFGYVSKLGFQSADWPPLYSFVFTFAQTNTVYFILAINLDRFILICYPLQAQSLCNWKIHKRVLCGIPSFSFLLSSIWLSFLIFDYSVEMSKSIKYWTNIVYVVIVQSLIPFLLLIVFNWKIFNAMQKSTKFRNKSTTTSSNTSSSSTSPWFLTPTTTVSSNEDSVSRMALAIVILFGICWFPVTVWAILWSFISIFPEESGSTSLWEIIYYLEYCGIITTAVNSSINFIIYCVIGSAFRQVGFELLCKARK